MIQFQSTTCQVWSACGCHDFLMACCGSIALRITKFRSSSNINSLVTPSINSSTHQLQQLHHLHRASISFSPRAPLGALTVPRSPRPTAPKPEASALAFTDQDLDASELGGTVTWQPPEVTLTVTGYRLYLAEARAPHGRRRGWGDPGRLPRGVTAGPLGDDLEVDLDVDLDDFSILIWMIWLKVISGCCDGKYSI